MLLSAVKRLDNGKLLIPRRADTGDEEGIIGDALVEIGPDDSEFAEWDAWLKEQDADTSA